MSINIFCTYMLMVSLVFFQVFSFFQNHFSGIDGLRDQVAALKEQVKAEELKSLVAQHETREIQQTVATLIPDAMKNEKNPVRSYALRNLASVVNEPLGASLHIEKASTIFEKAREQFRNKNYKTSNLLFSQLVEEYPDSVHVVESQFLLVESAYLSHQYATAVKNINLMMARYPDNVLTGFALLRLSKIYQETDRTEDATEVLKTVLNTYKDPVLTSQAQTSLKSLAP